MPSARLRVDVGEVLGFDWREYTGPAWGFGSSGLGSVCDLLTADYGRQAAELYWFGRARVSQIRASEAVAQQKIRD